MKRIFVLVLMLFLVACTVKENREEKVTFMTLYDLSGQEDIYSVSILSLKDLREKGQGGCPSDIVHLSKEEFGAVYQVLLDIKCSKEDLEGEESLETLPDYFIHFAFVQGEESKSYDLSLGQHYITLTDLKTAPDKSVKHPITVQEYKALVTTLEDF